MITASDRLATVLRQDPSLIEVLVSLSSAFERLRDPDGRKVMARLSTVAHAARMAGVDVDHLVNRLNAGGAPAPDGEDRMEHEASKEAAVVERTAGAAERPAGLAAIAPDHVVELDVREDLRSGREPFSRIMSALRTVPAGGALAVRAIFEPVPLYAVMARQGLVHHTEQFGESDWQVWFYPESTETTSTFAEEQPAMRNDANATEPEAGVVVLDVRGLEPPEPMVRTLEALEVLPAGETLLHINVRVPQFLLPQLEERGYTYEIREQAKDLVRVFIRRAVEARAPITSEENEMSEERVLDVRVIPPREKHPTIFQTFQSLAPGESFVLVNDHDPKPLRYQFEFEHRDQFGWEYLEEGPAVWRVEISRRAA